MGTRIFESVAWYNRFLNDEGDDIEILSVNIFKDDSILVTYKYKKEIY